MHDTVAHYQSFLAVAECGSISGAARRLYVTQPAVSAAIACLEKAHGVRLFFRTNRGVVLTPEGQILYDHVARGFSFIDAGEERMREYSDLRSGLLRMGACGYALRYILPELVADFCQSYPGVELRVEEANTSAILGALCAGQIDLGLVCGPLTAGDDVALLPLAEVQDVFLAGEEEEIAHHAVVEREALLSCPLLLPPAASAARQHLLACLGEALPQPLLEGAPDLLLQYAEKGVGVCVVTERDAEGALAEGRVVRLPLREALPPRRVYLAYLRHLPTGAAAEKMLSRVKEAYLVTEE